MPIRCPSGGLRTWTIPYPSEPVGKETAHVYLANYTHVFSATTTNEVVFAYSEFINNNSLSNVAASSRKATRLPGSESVWSFQDRSDPEFALAVGTPA